MDSELNLERLQKISEFSEFDKKKFQIISRFYNRKNVQEYLSLLSEKGYIDYLWKDKFCNLSEEVKEDIEDLFNLYNTDNNNKLQIVYLQQQDKTSHTGWGYECSSLKENDLDFYLPIFFQEFSLYPVSLISKSKLKTIYLCNSLNFITDQYTQYRAAVPDFHKDYMAMIYCCKEVSLKYIRNVIHHEFFHFLDYVEDGKIYDKDPIWESYNPADFEYGRGGAYEREWKPLENNKKEFLNFYSTTGIEEDKAEIYAFMMLGCNKIQDVENEGLKKKIEYIKNMMNRFDKQGFGKPNFWELLMKFREKIDNHNI